jgi:hypothetical protein
LAGLFRRAGRAFHPIKDGRPKIAGTFDLRAKDADEGMFSRVSGDVAASANASLAVARSM